MAEAVQATMEMLLVSKIFWILICRVLFIWTGRRTTRVSIPI